MVQRIHPKYIGFIHQIVGEAQKAENEGDPIKFGRQKGQTLIQIYAKIREEEKEDEPVQEKG